MVVWGPQKEVMVTVLHAKSTSSDWNPRVIMFADVGHENGYCLYLDYDFVDLVIGFDSHNWE